MLESYILKLNLALLEVEWLGVWLFFDHGILLQHQVQVFNIHVRLVNCSEEGAHIEQRT